jgi:hypothetical protein
VVDAPLAHPVAASPMGRTTWPPLSRRAYKLAGRRQKARYFRTLSGVSVENPLTAQVAIGAHSARGRT